MISNPAMDHGVEKRLHPVAWMIWCAAAVLITLAARSPWIMLGMGVIAVALLRRLEGQAFQTRRLIWLLPLVLIPAALNLLFSRAGSTVLLDFRLGWMGGPFTLEALVFGFLAGIQLAVTLLVFQVFSLMITPQDLLRRTPPAFYPLGVMASIAVTFAASVRRRFEALREAQQLRGNEVHGWKALPNVLTPLLVVSLEDAMATAEGLAAMGWASTEASQRAGRKVGPSRRLSGVIGWTLLAGAILFLVAPSGGRLTALALAGAGIVLVGINNRVAGRERYRPERWHWRDVLLVATSFGALGLVLYQVSLSPTQIIYQPYPRVIFPSLFWSQIIVLFLLATPVWIVYRD